MTSGLEAAFLTYWRTLAPGAPEPEREYRFAPPRRWRLDFAFPEAMVAVELDGGTWTGGRHVRGSGYAADCEKHNAAVLAGWSVLRLTGDMLSGNPVRWIGAIRELVAARAAGEDDL